MVPGLGGIPRISKYSSEYFFPLMFVLMMVIALLVTSFGRDWAARSPIRLGLGITLDVLMLAAVLSMAVVYLIEHEQVCLIDTLDGERARLMAETAARADEYRAIFGIDPVEEFPDCQTNLANWILPFLLIALAIFFIYIIKAWGFPIIAVALVIALYTVLSSAAWYFDWSGNRYLTTSIGTEFEGIRNREHMAHVDGECPLGRPGGEVEADETYIGGKTTGGKRGRGAPNKTVVFGMLERDGDVMAKVVPDVKMRTLHPIVTENVEPGARSTPTSCGPIADWTGPATSIAPSTTGPANMCATAATSTRSRGSRLA